MSFVAHAVASGVSWGITSSVAGAVSNRIREFTDDKTTTVVHSRQVYVHSGNGRSCNYETASITETYVHKEPSKASKALKAVKKNVKSSFVKVKSAIQQH